MSPSRTAPPLATIVRTDFLALFGALFAPIGIALAVAARAGVLPDRSRSLVEGRLVLVEGGAGTFWMIMAAGFVLVGALVVGWRCARIRAAFRSPLRVPGRITRLRPFKDRAYVHYEYRVNGRAIATRHLVHQTAAFRRLEAGQDVAIAVDPSRPGAGFVVDLFEGGAA